MMNNASTMKKEYNINKIIKSRKIQNEFDLEVALVCHRLLRLMMKDNPQLKTIHKRLGNMIKEYESENWSANSPISQSRIEESNLAELSVEKEIDSIRQSLIQFVQHSLQ